MILIDKSSISEPKIFFCKNLLLPTFNYDGSLLKYKNSEKLNDSNSRKPKKTSFLGIFWPKFAQKNFFSKIGLRHILGITILHHCAKNQKNRMSQSREKLITNGRTDERTSVNL